MSICSGLCKCLIHTEKSGRLYINCQLGPFGEWRIKWELEVSLIHCSI